ncbi:MAG TPA: AAA family ATPase [Solirubrobacter sp.]
MIATATTLTCATVDCENPATDVSLFPGGAALSCVSCYPATALDRVSVHDWTQDDDDIAPLREFYADEDCEHVDAAIGGGGVEPVLDATTYDEAVAALFDMWERDCKSVLPLEPDEARETIEHLNDLFAEIAHEYGRTQTWWIKPPDENENASASPDDAWWLDADEVGRRLKAARERWAETAPERADAAARARLVDMSEAIRLAGLAPAWVCDPIAARGALTVIAGKTGHGKTWLGLAIAYAVHGGGGDVGGIGGLHCRGGVALYVDAENGPRVIGRRFGVMDIEADGLLVADGMGLHLPTDIDELRELVRVTGATLVVLDSLRRLAPEMREDKSDDIVPVMAAIAELAREFDVAVIVLHNRSTKPGAPNMRGSSSIEDQCDAAFVLERVDGDRERARRRLRCIKHRLDGEPSSIWLQLEKVAGFVRWASAEPFERDERDDDDVEPEPPKPSKREQVAEVIRALGPQVLADDGWSPSRLAEAVGVEPDSGTFGRAVKLLVGNGEWDRFGTTSNRRLKPLSPSQRPLKGDGESGESQLELSPKTLANDGTPEGGPKRGESGESQNDPTDDAFGEFDELAEQRRKHEETTSPDPDDTDETGGAS